MRVSVSTYCQMADSHKFRQTKAKHMRHKRTTATIGTDGKVKIRSMFDAGQIYLVRAHEATRDIIKVGQAATTDMPILLAQIEDLCECVSQLDQAAEACRVALIRTQATGDDVNLAKTLYTQAVLRFHEFQIKWAHRGKA